ncbi:hypothetical protein L917_01831, partial [Phytophthora nicotianae]
FGPLPTPEKDPIYCKFVIERRVNGGVRHQAPTVGAAELCRGSRSPVYQQWK